VSNSHGANPKGQPIWFGDSSLAVSQVSIMIPASSTTSQESLSLYDIFTPSLARAYPDIPWKLLLCAAFKRHRFVVYDSHIAFRGNPKM
jgi:hypothetical protein